MSVVLHICPGPSWTVATAEDDRPTRWCFQCRKHLKHSWRLQEDPPERQPSYYDPVPVLACSRCGEDHTTHPGSYRDGPAYPGKKTWEALVAGRRRTWDDFYAAGGKLKWDN